MCILHIVRGEGEGGREEDGDGWEEEGPGIGGSWAWHGVRGGRIGCEERGGRKVEHYDRLGDVVLGSEQKANPPLLTLLIFSYSPKSMTYPTCPC